MVFVPHRYQTYGYTRAVAGITLLFLYVHYVRTSQETYVQAFTACYGDSFTFLYVDDVRTSQETYVPAFTACYGHSFTFYM
jgi:hypothetical protein